MPDILLVPLAALAIPLVITPIALGIRHARYLREVEHKERMRAMDLGRVLPCDQTWTSPSRLIAGIGIVVPLVALAVASKTVTYGNGVGTACGMIGVAGLVCGTWLANRYLFGATEGFAPGSKPIQDPDAFDVVGRRG